MQSCALPQLVRISAARSSAQRPTLAALPRPSQGSILAELSAHWDQTCLNCSIISASSFSEDDKQKRLCQ